MSLFLSAAFFMTVVTVVTPDFVPSMTGLFNESRTANPKGEQIAPLAEETIWYTRIYNGKLQRRLWSITNGCWLTEWMDF